MRLTRLGWLPAIAVLCVVALVGSQVRVARAAGIVAICDEAHFVTAVTGGGTVTFSCNGTITLTSPIVVTATLTVDGTGHTITLNGGDTSQLFVVDPGGSLTLKNLKVRNGDAAGGGAIENNGSLTVDGVTFFNNHADFAGGAILSAGTLVLNNSTFTSNTAGFLGGAIASGPQGIVPTSPPSAGPTSITNSTFKLNHAGVAGGAIHHGAGGLLTVDHSTFTGNFAGAEESSCTCQIGRGGAINVEDLVPVVGSPLALVPLSPPPASFPATITWSTFTLNIALLGGAVNAGFGGTLDVSNSFFRFNVALLGGALRAGLVVPVVPVDVVGPSAVLGLPGPVTVFGTTFSNNFALVGGGIWTNFGLFTLSESTVEDGFALFGGGIGEGPWSNLTVAHSTISGNTAVGASSEFTLLSAKTPGLKTSDTSGPLGLGGGIFWAGAGLGVVSVSSPVDTFATIVNSTLAGNSAGGEGAPCGEACGRLESLLAGASRASVSEAAGVLATLGIPVSAAGGAIFSAMSGMTLKNTIAADSPHGGDCAALAPVADGGGNLVEDGSCGFPAAPDPQLGTLQLNGGGTKTMAITKLSPAFNTGLTATCSLPEPDGAGQHDQREVVRVFCSKGAYEPGGLGPIGPLNPSGSPVSAYPGFGGPNPDTLPGWVTQQQQGADLALTETPTTKGRMGVRFYKFEITNNGPFQANDVVLTVKLPPGVQLDRSKLPQGCTVQGGGDGLVIVCKAPSIAVGGTFSFEIEVYGAGDLPQRVKGTVVSGSVDLNPANNTVQ